MTDGDWITLSMLINPWLVLFAQLAFDTMKQRNSR
jgi:hypothetical protein